MEGKRLTVEVNPEFLDMLTTLGIILLGLSFIGGIISFVVGLTNRWLDGEGGYLPIFLGVGLLLPGLICLVVGFFKTCVIIRLEEEEVSE